MKKILWITTGGTIASGPTAHGLTPQLKGEDFLYLIPELKELAQIDCVDLLNLDSTNVSPQDWLTMAHCLEQHYQNYDGFVISHGTDTLTWTGAALKLILQNLNKPVALVASQLTYGEENSDAPANLMAAFTVATQATPDVYIVCAGFVFPALWVTKIASENLDCFRPTNKEPVGTYDLNYQKNQLTPVYWLTKTTDSPEEITDQPLKVRELDLNKKIFHLTLTPLTSPELITTLAPHYNGFIIEAYGAGGIPSAPENDLLSSLEALTAANKPVICISQCLYDGVHMDRYQVGQNALASGIISGGKLAREAANILLLLSLSQNQDLNTIAQTFQQYN